MKATLDLLALLVAEARSGAMFSLARERSRESLGFDADVPQAIEAMGRISEVRTLVANMAEAINP